MSKYPPLTIQSVLHSEVPPNIGFAYVPYGQDDKHSE